MKQPLGNVRGLLLSSIVGASLLFSGCGSGASSESDAQGDNPVGSTLQTTASVESLVGTVNCLLGVEDGGLGLTAPDLQVLSAVPIAPEDVLAKLAEVKELNPDVSTVQDLLAVPMTLEETLALLQSSVPADSDALAVITGLKDKLAGGNLLDQNVDPAALLALPAGIDPQQTLTVALGQLGDPTSALAMVENAAQNIAGDVMVCTPQAAVVVDTVECLLGAGTDGLPLTTADLRSLAGADLTLEGLLAQAQTMDPSITSVEELLAAPMAMGDALTLLGGSLPVDSDAVGVLTGLKDTMSTEALGQMIDLGTLLPVPADALTSPMGALALVEGLAMQSTVVAQQCLKPEATIASLGSMLGAESGLPLDPAGLLTLAGTDLTVNDLLAAAHDANPTAATVDELLATPLDAGMFLNALGANLPAEVQPVLAGVAGTLPVGQTITLGDLMTLPTDVLALPAPVQMDLMDTSLQDALGASTNTLAMMQMMAKYMDSETIVTIFSGMATQSVIATVSNAGGFVLADNLMTQLPSDEALSADVPADLQELVTTVLSTEDPSAVVAGLLDPSLVSGLLGGLLGGTDLLDELTTLLGDETLASTLSTILEGLPAETDPTATLETLQGLLEGTLNDPTATPETVQELFGILPGA